MGSFYGVLFVSKFIIVFNVAITNAISFLYFGSFLAFSALYLLLLNPIFLQLINLQHTFSPLLLLLAEPYLNPAINQQTHQLEPKRNHIHTDYDCYVDYCCKQASTICCLIVTDLFILIVAYGELVSK